MRTPPGPRSMNGLLSARWPATAMCMLACIVHLSGCRSTSKEMGERQRSPIPNESGAPGEIAQHVFVIDVYLPSEPWYSCLGYTARGAQVSGSLHAVGNDRLEAKLAAQLGMTIQSVDLELVRAGESVKVARATNVYEDDRTGSPLTFEVTSCSVYLSSDDWSAGSDLCIDIAGTSQYPEGGSPRVFIAHWCGTID
jgi:hypothetical protein